MDKKHVVYAHRRKATGFLTVYLRDRALPDNYLVQEVGIPYTLFMVELSPSGHVYSRLGAAESISALKTRLLGTPCIVNLYRQSK